ncbi:MAG: hypothetical protein U1F57_01535 [bacterium]
MSEVKDVFHIIEREPAGAEPAKSVWTKIGVAFVNKDKSLNVMLDVVPLDGKIHIRERRAAPTAKK